MLNLPVLLSKTADLAKLASVATSTSPLRRSGTGLRFWLVFGAVRCAVGLLRLAAHVAVVAPTPPPVAKGRGRVVLLAPELHRARTLPLLRVRGRGLS